MTDFEKVQLQWMMDNGHSIGDLVAELSEMQYEDPEDSDRISTPISELFNEWLEERRGFTGEIWPREEECKKAIESKQYAQGNPVYARIENGCCSKCGCPIPTDSASDCISEMDIGYCYGCGARLTGEDTYRVRYEFTELGENGAGDSDASVYELEDVKSVADVRLSLNDTLRMYVEIDGIPQGANIKVETTVMSMHRRDVLQTSTAVIHIDSAVRTDEPSKFIVWGTKAPHIFTVDTESFAWSTVIQP